jgi:hypothetical protein
MQCHQEIIWIRVGPVDLGISRLIRELAIKGYAHFMLRSCCLYPWNNTHSEPSGQIQRDIIISELMVVDEIFSRVEAGFR